MKVIVTGATGFVGKWLVDKLLEQKDDVAVIVRDKKRIPKEWEPDVHVVEASLESYESLDKNSFPWKTADIFFHLAWAGTAGVKRADVTLQLQNVKASCEAVKFASAMKCRRFVNAGSIMEYEAMNGISVDDANPSLGCIYSTAKLAADFMAKTIAVSEHLSYINVIISNIYGAGESSPRFLNTTLKKMLKDEEIPFTAGTQMYDFIYVTDAVNAVIEVARKGEDNSSYYIGNSNQRPLKEFVLEMRDVLHSKARLLFGEIPMSGTPLTYQEFDTTKLERMGIIPEVTFARGIELTRDWILEE